MEESSWEEERGKQGAGGPPGSLRRKNMRDWEPATHACRRVVNVSSLFYDTPARRKDLAYQAIAPYKRINDQGFRSKHVGRGNGNGMALV
jgi:hypothetical protein